MAVSWLERSQISAKAREDWYRALSKTAADGLPVYDVLVRMEKDFALTKHPLTPLVRDLLWKQRGGKTVSKGESGSSNRTLGTQLVGLVPDNEAMLIQAGAVSGNLAAGLWNAADLVATQGKMRATVVGSLMKPIGYIAALIGLLLFFSTSLLPKFEQGRPRSRWPAEAQLLGVVADNVGLVTGGIIALMVLALVVVLWLGPNWTGPRREWCDRKLFPFTLMASLNGASLLTSLSGYISAGTPFTTAIETIRSSANPYMKTQCDRLMGFMKSGMKNEEALTRLSMVQPRYHWIINVYGLSGDASTAYRSIAAEMVERTQAFVRNLFDGVISKLLMLLVGAVLMWIYLSMFGIADSGIKKAALNPGNHVAVA